jgi:hypothetical protein
MGKCVYDSAKCQNVSQNSSKSFVACGFNLYLQDRPDKQPLLNHVSSSAPQASAPPLEVPDHALPSYSILPEQPPPTAHDSFTAPPLPIYDDILIVPRELQLLPTSPEVSRVRESNAPFETDNSKNVISYSKLLDKNPDAVFSFFLTHLQQPRVRIHFHGGQVILFRLFQRN